MLFCMKGEQKKMWKLMGVVSFQCEAFTLYREVRHARFAFGDRIISYLGTERRKKTPLSLILKGYTTKT